MESDTGLGHSAAFVKFGMERRRPNDHSRFAERTGDRHQDFPSSFNGCSLLPARRSTAPGGHPCPGGYAAARRAGYGRIGPRRRRWPVRGLPTAVAVGRQRCSTPSVPSTQFLMNCSAQWDAVVTSPRSCARGGHPYRSPSSHAPAHGLLPLIVQTHLWIG